MDGPTYMTDMTTNPKVTPITIAIVCYCPRCDYFVKTAVEPDKVGTHGCTRCSGVMEVYIAQGSREAVVWHSEEREAWGAEHFRLRTLISEVGDGLGQVEDALVAVCQHSTNENTDQRAALFELRLMREQLKSNGRGTPADRGSKGHD